MVRSKKFWTLPRAPISKPIYDICPWLLCRADLADVTLGQVFFGSDDELDVVEVTGPQPQSQTMLITKPMLPDVPEATLPAAHGTAASRIALDLGKAFGIATDNFFVQVEVQHRGVLAQARSDRM